MWDIPFSTELLNSKNGVVIRCQEEHLSHELFDLLEQNGITWRNGDMSNTSWDDYGEDTAYFIRNRRILYGPYEHADWMEYEKYTKCTFYSMVPEVEIPDSDFETIVLASGMKGAG